MQRVLKIALTVCAMLLIAATAALLSLRLAIHGREVVVPDLSGLSETDSAAAARKLGLNFLVENRFSSSAVAANHVLSQAPAPGVRVRRGWQVRVTESLGPQHVSPPDLTGQAERPAQLLLSHLQLELAPAAYLPAAGAPGVVVAQLPSPGAVDAGEPRVALLLSGNPEDPASISFVMPHLSGLSVRQAIALLETAGLHLSDAVDTSAPLQSTVPAIAPSQPSPAAPQAPAIQTAHPAQTRLRANPDAIIATQSPAPDSRVTRADAIHVTVVPGARSSRLVQP